MLYPLQTFVEDSKKAGVYPYNRSAVLMLESGCNNSSEECEENGAVSEDGRSEGEAIVSFSVAVIYTHTLFLFIFFIYFFFLQVETLEAEMLVAET